MTLAPIVLFCYRRLDCLKQTVEALQKNKEAKESLLFIFSDGFKNEEDKLGVEEVRRYIKTINGFKKVEIIESPKNKGLANSIIDGVTRIVNEYGKIIVVEDDILTSPYFLKYMNDALDMYEKDENVGCISGYVYPIKKNKNQTFFIKGSHCWGWATWKRAWDIFESDGQKLLDEVQNKHLKKEFDFDYSYLYSKMLKDQIEGRNNSWYVRWYASCFLNNKLCLYPGKSFVQNIGFGLEGAEHCSAKTNIFDSDLQTEELVIEKIKPKENKKCRKLLIQYFNIVSARKGNFLFRKERCGNKRIITIMGFIKFTYIKGK